MGLVVITACFAILRSLALFFAKSWHALLAKQSVVSLPQKKHAMPWAVPLHPLAHRSRQNLLLVNPNKFV
jgi:hypothetical protein